MNEMMVEQIYLRVGREHVTIEADEKEAHVTAADGHERLKKKNFVLVLRYSVFVIYGPVSSSFSLDRLGTRSSGTRRDFVPKSS